MLNHDLCLNYIPWLLV